MVRTNSGLIGSFAAAATRGLTLAAGAGSACAGTGADVMGAEVMAAEVMAADVMAALPNATCCTSS